MQYFCSDYIERRYPDGTVQSHLPDGTIKWIKPGKVEECRFPDGTLVSVNNIGEQTIRFPNGQVEIHTSEFMVGIQYLSYYSFLLTMVDINFRIVEKRISRRYGQNSPC